MALPTVGSSAARLYQQVQPMAESGSWSDEQYGYALLFICQAMMLGNEELELFIRDTVDGPGWSAFVDPDRTPAWALPWLAQSVGVDLTPAASEAVWRQEIKEQSYWKRGTVPYIEQEVKKLLTGNKRVKIFEQDTSPYHYTVTTKDSETPDPTAVLNRLKATKPGALQFTYSVLVGQDYQDLADTYADYTAVAAAYLTYADVRDDPGP
jgi:hypothetical protein